MGIPTSEFLAIDGLATSAIVPGEITALKHELRDHTVETRSCVAKAILASGKLPEVSCSFGDLVIKQLENDSASRGTVDGDVELQEKNRKEKDKNKMSTPEKLTSHRNGTHT